MATPSPKGVVVNDYIDIEEKPIQPGSLAFANTNDSFISGHPNDINSSMVGILSLEHIPNPSHYSYYVLGLPQFNRQQLKFAKFNLDSLPSCLHTRRRHVYVQGPTAILATFLAEYGINSIKHLHGNFLYWRPVNSDKKYELYTMTVYQKYNVLIGKIISIHTDRIYVHVELSRNTLPGVTNTGDS